MRYRYTLTLPDGTELTRELSAESPEEAASLCDDVWREAGFNPAIDDFRIRSSIEVLAGG